jgi:sarcosine oxidase subunit delta
VWLTEMLRIPCPFCGVRDEPEFTFGGPSHVTRPPLTASDAAWTEYLYVRDNPAGVHHERWCHTFGCGRWFTVARNTLTHGILTVYPIGEPKPTVPNE